MVKVTSRENKKTLNNYQSKQMNKVALYSCGFTDPFWSTRRSLKSVKSVRTVIFKERSTTEQALQAVSAEALTLNHFLGLLHTWKHLFMLIWSQGINGVLPNDEQLIHFGKDAEYIPTHIMIRRSEWSVKRRLDLEISFFGFTV